MKVIDTDLYNREDVADILIADNLSESEAKALVDKTNEGRTELNSTHWAIMVPDDRRLSRGMEDLI